MCCLSVCYGSEETVKQHLLAVTAVSIKTVDYISSD